MNLRVFIDGAAGATGLALEERLSALAWVTLIKPDEALRKDPDARRTCLNDADVSFLCLPDVAAREAVSMADNPELIIIDASTAHRTAPGWAYGFPELSPKHYEAVRTGNRIAVPGCHASGFAALVYPLVTGGIIHAEQALSCHSLTGYSGGGKTMIEQYENPKASDLPSAARLYALGLTHKHLPEMTAVCGLKHPPLFVPAVANARQGMMVCVPLPAHAETVWQYLNDYYQNTGQITVMPFGSADALALEGMNNTDHMELYVSGHETQTLLTARFDNLGKGSCGAAVQCLKVRMGLCDS